MYNPTLFVFFLTVMSASVAYAESPPCNCALDSGGTPDTAPAASCVKWEAGGEACNGATLNVSFNNECVGDIVFDNEEGAVQPQTTVKPGESGVASWTIPQEGAPQSKDLSLSFDATIDGASHKMTFTGRLTCTPATTDSSDGGCSSTRPSSRPDAWGFALALAMLALLWRRRTAATR